VCASIGNRAGCIIMVIMKTIDRKENIP
jgi:hypothetical protein